MYESHHERFNRNENNKTFKRRFKEEEEKLLDKRALSSSDDYKKQRKEEKELQRLKTMSAITMKELSKVITNFIASTNS